MADSGALRLPEQIGTRRKATFHGHDWCIEAWRWKLICKRGEKLILVSVSVESQRMWRFKWKDFEIWRNWGAWRNQDNDYPLKFSFY